MIFYNNNIIKFTHLRSHYLRAMNQVPSHSLIVGNATNESDNKKSLPAAIYIVIIVLALLLLCGCCIVCFARVFYGSLRNFWHDLRHGRREGEEAPESNRHVLGSSRGGDLLIDREREDRGHPLLARLPTRDLNRDKEEGKEQLGESINVSVGSEKNNAAPTAGIRLGDRVQQN